MALTGIQQTVLRVIADSRKRTEGYVAGGVALNTLLDAPRLSHDIDLFHDSAEALAASWAADRALLENAGFTVRVVRERPAFVEAVVLSGDASVLLQWVQDSAYRFFPLIEHPILGLTLHPFDLATNKVLAMAGRLEPRDWIDAIHCDASIQPFGLLIWAACGKDPGYGPVALLGAARRSGRYSREEIATLAFDGPPPAVEDLARRWHAMLADAEAICAALPPAMAGRAVTDADGRLFRGSSGEIARQVGLGQLRFLEGSIRGVLPRIIEAAPSGFKSAPAGQIVLP